MGQQQLLLIILGVIIVGIAIAVGLQLFQSGSVGANQDAMVNDLMNLSSHADQWRIRPETMGGGGGTFDGYVIPDRLATTGNAVYTIHAAGAGSEIGFTATSAIHDGTVTLDYDADGTDDRARYEWASTGVFDIESVD